MKLVVGEEAFGHGEEFRSSLCSPFHATVIESFDDLAEESAPKGLYAVAGFERGSLRQGFHHGCHGFSIKHACHVMRHGGGDLFESGGRKVAEKNAEKSAGDVGKSIPVKEEEGGFAMKSAQPVECFGETGYFGTPGFPLLAARLSTF